MQGFGLREALDEHYGFLEEDTFQRETVGAWHHTLRAAMHLFFPERPRLNAPTMRPYEAFLGLDELLSRQVAEALTAGNGPLGIPLNELKRHVAELEEDSGDATVGSYRSALSTMVFLSKDLELTGQVQDKLRHFEPRISDCQCQQEADFLTQPGFRLEDFPGAQYLWVHRLVDAITHMGYLAPFVALAIEHCRERELDLGTWLGEIVDEIDADMVLANGLARYKPIKAETRIIRKPVPVLQHTLGIEGTGGRIGPAIADVLELPLYFFALTEVHDVLALKESPKDLKLKSKAEIKELMSDPEAVVRIRLELSGDLSIEDSDLDIYRKRLDHSIEWARVLFPFFNGRTEIVVA